MAQLTSRLAETEGLEAVSASTLMRIEQGRTIPRLGTTLTIARAYGISPQRIFALLSVGEVSDEVAERADWHEMLDQSAIAVRESRFREAYNLADRVAQSATDPELILAARGNRAVSLKALGILDEASSEMITILSVPHLRPVQQAHTRCFLVEVYRDQANLAVARDFATGALEPAKRSGSREIQATAESVLGNVLSDQGEYEADDTGRLFRQAIHHYEKAMELVKDVGPLELLVLCRTNIAIARFLEGNRTLGLNRIHDALNEFRTMDYAFGIGLCLRYLGTFYQKLSRHEEAIQFLTDCETVAAQMGDVGMRFRALCALRRSRMALGDSGETLFRRMINLRYRVHARTPEIVAFDEELRQREASSA